MSDLKVETISDPNFRDCKICHQWVSQDHFNEHLAEHARENTELHAFRKSMAEKQRERLIAMLAWEIYAARMAALDPNGTWTSPQDCFRMAREFLFALTGDQYESFRRDRMEARSRS